MYFLKIKIKITLQDSKKTGKMLITLPFVEKLKKLILSDTAKNPKIPH